MTKLTVRGSAPASVGRLQPGEDAFGVGDDVGGEDDDEMVVGQEVERRRIVGAGDERQRAGLGDAGEGGADGVEIVALGGAARDFERGRRPRHIREALVVAEAQGRRQVVFAQVSRDLGRNVGGRRDFGDASPGRAPPRT